jgi:hypothetical protein
MSAADPSNSICPSLPPQGKASLSRGATSRNACPIRPISEVAPRSMSKVSVVIEVSRR